MNVLITSASAKIPLIDAFQRACKSHAGYVVTTDCDHQCLAAERADHFYLVPRVDMPAYRQKILDICKKNKIKLIIPTRDDDFMPLIALKSELKAIGAFLPLPSAHQVENCLNKKLFIDFCIKNNFPTLPIVEPTAQAQWPLFVRAKRGAGGTHGKVIHSWLEWQKSGLSVCDVICQPVCSDTEYSIDVLMDLEGNPLQAVVRQRLHITNGESLEGRIVSRPFLEEKSMELCCALELRGHNVVQAFNDDRGSFNFIEVNARFGGGSLMSVYAGLNSPDRLIQMIAGHREAVVNNREINVGALYRRNKSSLYHYDEIKT